MGQAFICDACGDIHSGSPWTSSLTTEREEALDAVITMYVKMEVTDEGEGLGKPLALCNDCVKKVVFGRVIKELDALNKRSCRLGNVNERRPPNAAKSVG